MLLSGRGPEQQSKGVDTVLAFTNLMLALGKVGKPASGYGCITGQGNGQGGREMGQKADQLPGYRLIENPEHRAALARVWGIDAARLPGKGKSAYELLDALGPEGGIRALLVFGSNVAVASPDARHIARRLASLELLVVCDAFENETSATADVILPVAQWAEEEGTMTNLEGRVILRRRGARRPARREDRHRDHLRARRAAGRGRALSLRRPGGGLRRAAPRDGGRQGRLQRHHLRAHRPRAGRVLAVSVRGSRRHAADVHGRVRAPRRQGAVHAGAAPTGGGAARRAVPVLLHDRAVQGALQLGRADAPGGGAGRRQARAARAGAPAAGGATGRGRRRRVARREPARRGDVHGDGEPGHSPRHAVRAVSLGRAHGGEHPHQAGARSDEPHAGVQGVRGARAGGGGGRAGRRRERRAACARSAWRSSATGWPPAVWSTSSCSATPRRATRSRSSARSRAARTTGFCSARCSRGRAPIRS